MSILDQLLALYSTRGNAAYFGEAVSQTEHALQSAHLAVCAGAGNALVAAALLHDIGHLLHGLPESVAAEGIDGCHETGGADWLERWFGQAVTAPIRLHVAAKRYLCAVDPDYLSGLSPASQRSLELQGGPFPPEEVRRFARLPFAREAIDLRRWDDAAKVPGLVVPGLEYYRSCLEAALAAKVDS